MHTSSSVCRTTDRLQNGSKILVHTVELSGTPLQVGVEVVIVEVVVVEEVIDVEVDDADVCVIELVTVVKEVVETVEVVAVVVETVAVVVVVVVRQPLLVLRYTFDS